MKILKFDIGLYRGSRPESVADMQSMRDRYGIQTILNLQPDSHNEQVAWAVEAGIRSPLAFGLSSVFPPDHDSVMLATSVLANDLYRPLFLHCHMGVDRTGFIVAAYRMMYQGWTYEAALKEMRDNGHQWWLYWWDGFLKKYEKK